MMRPTYPNIPAYVQPQEPESTTRVVASASGRIRTYDLGGFSDQVVTLRHAMVLQPKVDEVMAFWRANRGQLFNLQTGLGDRWIASFVKQPQRIHHSGPWYHVDVTVVRYLPEEGGL